MAKKSYADVKRQVEALLEQQQAMERRAVDIFVKALMKSGSGEKLVELSGADLQAVAKLVAANMDGTIKQAQVGKKPAKAQLPETPGRPEQQFSQQFNQRI